MRQAFVHEALLTLPASSDRRGPGAAITLALCGAWEHPPPCPVAPHHTSEQSVPEGILVRTVFVVAPEQERQVRDRIDEALARGRQVGPDGDVTTWSVVDSRAGVLGPDEQALGQRLASG